MMASPMAYLYALVVCLLMVGQGHSQTTVSLTGEITFCPYVVQYQDMKNGTVQFTITGKVDSGDYISIGLSNDVYMDEASLIACIHYNSKVYAQLIYTPAKYAEKVSNMDGKLELLAGDYKNGILTCHVTRALNSSNNKVFDLKNATYYVLFARGKSANKDSVEKHFEKPQLSSKKVNIQVATKISGGSQLGSQKAHACLMLIAWILCSSLGVVLARHYKKMFPGVKIMDKDVWFQVHRGLMLFALLCTAIAFIVIFVAVDGYSQFGQGPNDKRVHMAHPILGIIVMAFVIINPTLALFRCHPGTRLRPVFNLVHWSVGTVARVAAIVTIFIGFDMLSTWIHSSGIIVMAIYVAYEVLFEVALELIVCTAPAHPNEVPKLDDFELKPSGVIDRAITILLPPRYKLRMAMYIIHAIVVTIFTIALIIIVAIGGSTSACA